MRPADGFLQRVPSLGKRVDLVPAGCQTLGQVTERHDDLVGSGPVQACGVGEPHDRPSIMQDDYRNRLGLETGPGDRVRAREGALVVGRRTPADPLRRLVGLLPSRICVDAYLEETRGPAWQPDLDGGEGGGS